MCCLLMNRKAKIQKKIRINNVDCKNKSQEKVKASLYRFPPKKEKWRYVSDAIELEEGRFGEIKFSSLEKKNSK